jgi:polyphosphate kinase
MHDKQTLPEHFINRELSWLEFNARVLEEAQDPSTKLLERVKFLSIFSSNLDEFFMVRVAGLREQAFGAGAPQDENPDGMRAVAQLEQITLRTKQLVAEQYRCLREDIRPALEHEGISIVNYAAVSKEKQLDLYFREAVFPTLTPMAIDPSHPRPKYQNRGLYVAVALRRRTGMGPRNLFAVVHVPQVLPRLVPVQHPERRQFILLEELVSARLPELFGGFEVEKSIVFRITRDSDIDLIEREADDMLRMIEERLKAQRRADAVRLEVHEDADEELVQIIVEQEELRGAARGLHYTDVYRVNGPVDLTGLMSLSRLDDFDHLRDPSYRPTVPRGLRRHGEDLYSAIRRRDILLHHPYDSFAPVVEFVSTAARDPHVLAIKQTLYRTSGDSPIIRALMDAADNGKHVTALVELKARFDEQANVGWARKLEQSGVHVVYGFMDLKTHCKVSLVVRQEENVVRRYVHLGTGNYNPTTARLYTDLGLFTTNDDVATDVLALFNLLTGYSQGHTWRKLVVAPTDLQRRTVELIDEQRNQAEAGKPSRIFAKLNSLVDPEVIRALYRASQAGVPTELVIRGICCLRPGIKGMSENIRVRSIVDRFLEHSRIMVFGPDESAEIYLSSADWMPRNFYRRVEVMFPIESPPLKKRVLQELIPSCLLDNVRARLLRSDGTYERIMPKNGESPYRSQEEMIKLHHSKAITKTSLSTNGDLSSLELATKVVES